MLHDDVIASALRAAAETLTPCPPPTHHDAALTVEGAYAIQAANIALRKSTPIGCKIGLTSRAVQRQLGVSQPDFGVLLEEMLVPQNGEIERAKLLQPRGEAEIAFVMGQDLHPERPVTGPDILRATAFLLPAIEVIDSRIADWKISYVDTIADNASSGLFVLGHDPVKLDAVRLELCGMALRKNGHVVSTGAGLATMGHPLQAMVWLANTLRLRGRPLREGDIVLSGALGPVTPVEAGDFLRAEISGLGGVSVRFV